MQIARRVGTLGFGLSLGSLFFGCRVTDAPPVEPVMGPKAPTDAAAAVASDPEVAAQVLAVMDEGADPCVDFYRYACGQWLDETPQPADQPRFGRFHQLRDANKQVMREILEAAAADPNAEGDRAKLGRFYASCMDEGAAEAAGLTGVQPLLAKIDAARTPAETMALVADLQYVGARPLFRAAVEPDYDDPGTEILHLGQGGLGLPDRSYYLEDGAEADALRQAYVEHVALVLSAAGVVGDAAAERTARQVLAFETELARVSLPRHELRDPERQRNAMTRAALGKRIPSLPWAAWFEALGRPDVERFNVASPSYLEGMAKAWTRAKAPVRRAYLQWHLLHAIAEDLPARIADAHHELYERRLQGQQAPTPRWRRCVDTTDAALGEALGREFVQQRFSGSSKEIAVEMIAQIEQAFADALPQLSWMDDSTRERALEKMHAIVNKVGYPAKWRDYGPLSVGSDHVANVLAARRFEGQREVAQIGKPVDDDAWEMTPPTVNAYYNPSGNEMVFPAGILQPPFFDADRPMAMNFGGIGMVMGHELSHGFDDSGRKFDGEGRLTQWWGADVVERFEERAACVEELYGTYEVQPGVPLNGKLTLGENIADLGGIRQAHGAYQAWAEAQGGDVPAVEGLTNEQLLFVSYGQIWCTHATPEAERALVLTDSHSHARYRVNGPLANFPAFWEAFSCEEGTPMHPAKVCEVW